MYICLKEFLDYSFKDIGDNYKEKGREKRGGEMDLFYRQSKSFFSTIIAFFIAFILFYKRPQFSLSAIIVSFFIFLSLYITAPTIPSYISFTNTFTFAFTINLTLSFITISFYINLYTNQSY
jgi:hypothetical protein